MNIYQRINAVRSDVTSVAKDSTVRTGGEDYKAVTHDAVTAAVRHAMIVHGIVVVPTLVESNIVEAGQTKRGTTIIRFEGVYDVHFVNVNEPQDKLTLRTAAHANDMGDKAPGKALSYATKSAMLKVFSLETGADDESRVDPGAKTGNVDQLLAHMGAVRECIPMIHAVKQCLLSDDLDAAAEAWAELTRKEEVALWLAPTKGGVFTTDERAKIKSTEFTTLLKGRRTDAGWYDNPENQA